MAKKTSIGGQAIIEGVMMRGPGKIAIAVRKPDGEIVVKVDDNVPITKKNKFYGLPIIRGAISLFDSMIIGIKALTYSASFFDEPEEEDKFDKFLKAKLGDKTDDYIIGFSMIISFIIAIGLFFILPTFAASIIKKLTSNPILINLLEGVLRIVIFFFYLFFISRMKEIQRVFEYHGAEHKSIFCYEAELPLTPENATKFDTLHPRCGTNFMLIVMVISIVIFSFLGWPNLLMRILSRIVLLPVVAGVSYEILKWFGRSDSLIAKIFMYPGMILQRLTTRKPDDSQLEVALAALMAVLPDGEGMDDKW
jgi:uncharacterized protein YqhQ